ncbi:MAG: bifunctional nuclease family protein [Acidobacteria bacterium]|nr:bifunctional nuclease family protein [Acidobacteriota bacterium]
MHRKIFLLSLLVFSFCLPLRAQRRNGPAVEVKVEDLETTPLGINITLQDINSPDHIQMVIGFTEGQAIAQALRHRAAPRPMTHDLFKTFLDRNGWRVQKVLIRELAGGTFFADLSIEHDGDVQVYDARPSDAMAIGLRYDAKIYVNKEVFEQQKRQEEKPEELKPSEPKTRKL